MQNLIINVHACMNEISKVSIIAHHEQFSMNWDNCYEMINLVILAFTKVSIIFMNILV